MTPTREEQVPGLAAAESDSSPNTGTHDGEHRRTGCQQLGAGRKLFFRLMCSILVSWASPALLT